MRQPAPADAGGASFGENPTISVAEFYITPLDYLLVNSGEQTESPEESTVSDLHPGKIIGFRVVVHDVGPDGYWTSLHELRGEDVPMDQIGIDDTDDFVTGILLGPDQGDVEGVAGTGARGVGGPEP